MIRRLLLAAACLATFAACGTEAGAPASPDELPTATSPEVEQGTSSTRRGGTTRPERTTTTRRSTTTTSRSSSGTIPSSNPIVQELANSDDLIEIGADETVRQCVVAAAEKGISDGTISGTDRNSIGFFVGGATVGCAGSEKIARGFAAAIRKNLSGDLTPTQLDCLETQLVALPATQLATMVGGGILRDNATVDQIFAPINTACGTSL